MTLRLSGQKFGRVAVIDRAPNQSGRVMWNCRCDCGHEVVVRGSALTSGNSKSCGCLVAESMAATGRKNGTHNLSRTPEYHSWKAMSARCYDPNNNRFRYYGARGVTVCQRWRDSFEAFLSDMGPKPSPRHSIDRKETNGRYEPDNCRWATPSEQSKNRRPYRTHTTKLEPDQARAIRNDTRPKVEIASEYGISGRQVLAVQRREAWASID